MLVQKAALLRLVQRLWILDKRQNTLFLPHSSSDCIFVRHPTVPTMQILWLYVVRGLNLKMGINVFPDTYSLSQEPCHVVYHHLIIYYLQQMRSVFYFPLLCKTNRQIHA